MNYKTQKKILLATFLFLPMALLAMFMVYPTLRMFFMSFTDWNGTSKTYTFLGLRNYLEVFAARDMWISLRNNGIYLIMSVIQNILALIFANILVTRLKGRNVFRAILFLPYIINSVAVAYIFNFVYDYSQSPINVLLTGMGMSPVRFLSNPSTVTIFLAIISLWRFTGYTMVVYIAGLEAVDKEQYEAAVVDGASAVQKFLYITLPNMKRIIELNMFLCISGSLQAFTEALILTQGGPGNASSTYVTYVVKTAYQYNNYGLASAMSVVLLLIVLLVTVVQHIALRERGGNG